jgi:uncharacterized protein DUF2784
MTAETYALVANTLLLLHALFVLFVVGGQVLILGGWWRSWAWPRNLSFRIGHLVATLFVMLETWIGLACPLTIFENRLRTHAGQSPYDNIGFIGHWVHKFLFYAAPEWVFTLLYSAFALLVVASFMFYRPRRNPRWKVRSKNAE